MKTLLLSLTLLTSFSGFASTIFRGTQPRTNHNCSLEIVQFIFDENGNVNSADVKITFVDGGHGSTEVEELDFTVPFATTGNVLRSINQQDTLQIEIAAGSVGLTQPVRYGIRFLHGTHFHSAQCQNLRAE